MRGDFNGLERRVDSLTSLVILSFLRTSSNTILLSDCQRAIMLFIHVAIQATASQLIYWKLSHPTRLFPKGGKIDGVD